MRSENVLPPSEAEPLCSWTSRAETHCLRVNMVNPTEVKIVPGFILSQQSQPRLGQKQYLDMAADVPKWAREDRPARGTLGIAGLSGDKSWFLRTQARDQKCIIGPDAQLKALIYRCFKLNVLRRSHTDSFPLFVIVSVISLHRSGKLQEISADYRNLKQIF